jgi:uncharacterized repeat protein (TIGR02543 family)
MHEGIGMDIKKILMLLLFTIAVLCIITHVNAVNMDKKVKLTLDANGGKVGSKTTSLSTWKIGAKVKVDSIPHRSGYEFKGWYTKKSGGTKINKPITMKKNTTYYAHWKDIKTLRIKISYPGKFTAGYGAGNGTKSANKKDDFTSSGYVEINLGNSTYVNVGAKKCDNSSKLLKLSVLKGDKVVAEKITREPYGEVKISYKS